MIDLWLGVVFLGLGGLFLCLNFWHYRLFPGRDVSVSSLFGGAIGIAFGLGLTCIWMLLR